MKVYCAQLDIAWENKPENYRRARALFASAQPAAGGLVVLPEMFSTGFSMNVAGISEQGGGGAEQFVKDLAAEFGVYILAGVVSQAPDRTGLNEAIAISPDGELLARYAKIHPFTLGGELAHYSRGRTIETFQWAGLKVAPFICYDLRFPEIFRSAVKNGVEMFAVIANWPNKREQHWVTLLQARAIENLAFVVGVNRAGKDPQLIYPGRSMIVDPHGTVLADGGPDEGIVSAEIRPEVVRDWRRDFPALKDIHWRE
jgi:predicted amidohydrolase